MHVFVVEVMAQCLFVGEDYDTLRMEFIRHSVFVNGVIVQGVVVGGGYGSLCFVGGSFGAGCVVGGTYGVCFGMEFQCVLVGGGYMYLLWV